MFISHIRNPNFIPGAWDIQCTKTKNASVYDYFEGENASTKKNTHHFH